MDRVRRQLGITEDGRLVRDGEPVVVAVLDSGISQHPDLKDALFAFYDFSGSAGKGGKRVFYQTPYDEYGHGTHGCGIIAGSGIASGGKYQGICPGVRLVVGKVLDEHGDGCVYVLFHYEERDPLDHQARTEILSEEGTPFS